MNLQLKNLEKFREYESGIYKDIPDSEYFKPAKGVINSSSLSAFRRGDNDKTKMNPSALLFGSALHMFVFEPDKYESSILIKPRFYGKGARLKAKEWKLNYPDKMLLTEAEDARVREMGFFVRNSRFYKDHFVEGGGKKVYNEVVAVSDTDIQGVKLKAKADSLSIREDGKVRILDLKTTRDSSENSFSVSYKKFGYDIQAALYSYVFSKCLGVKEVDFNILAISKKPPFSIHLYQVFNLNEIQEEMFELIQQYVKTSNI